jgi:hypothetical protein
MSELVHFHHLIDIALVAIALEMVGLSIWRRKAEGGFRPVDIAGHLAAGGFLLLALRLQVSGAHAMWVWLFLSLSLPAHLFDLVRRIRTADRGETPAPAE